MCLIRSMRNDRLVSIFIAEDPRPVLVQQSIICAASKYFKTAFTTDRFEEAKEGVLHVPEDDIVAWNVFIHWLVRGEISEEADFVTLVKAWSLGDKYIMPQFQDDTMYALFLQAHKIARDSNVIFEQAFAFAPKDSRVRQFIAEHAVTLILLKCYLWDYYKNLREDPAIAKDLLEAMIALEGIENPEDWRTVSENEGTPFFMRYMVGEGPTRAQDMFWHYCRGIGWLKTEENDYEE